MKWFIKGYRKRVVLFDNGEVQTSYARVYIVFWMQFLWSLSNLEEIERVKQKFKEIEK